eukprot:TRINITY_DN123286_c0_g1_i1.p1 TRINITY_DN123286_c0_g1~~TRINITY_DN123286_c0_g1_i1.p1  ORF type:complete len:275 (-),score=49.18 TRINITY_DN123286_c0_g1_i1:105-929(-)
MASIGAAITDWGVALACFWAFFTMYRVSGEKPKPWWFLAFMAVFLAEGLACLTGGFIWSAPELQETVRLLTDMDGKDLFFTTVTILGMAAEGFALLVAARATSSGATDDDVRWFAQLMALMWVALLPAYALMVAMSMSPGVAYQLFQALPLGIVAVTVGNWKNAQAAKDEETKTCWMRLFFAEALNLVGAGFMGAFDNDCMGASCISEVYPWESNPCRYITTTPPGATCPLPQSFNHAAVMHVCAIISVIVSVPALCRLLEVGWQPEPAKVASD